MLQLLLSVKEFSRLRSIDNSTKYVAKILYDGRTRYSAVCKEKSTFGISQTFELYSIGANANDDGMLIDRENLVRVSFAEHLDSR